MAEIYVTSTADSGTGTLRAAIAAAQAGDVILFDPVIFPVGTTTSILLSSYLTTSKSVNIYGGEADGAGGYTSGAVKSYYVYRDIDGVRTKVYVDDDNPATEGETVLFDNVCRVALDGQETTRIFFASQNFNVLYSGLSLNNGNIDNSTGGATQIRAGIHTFADCAFNSCTSPSNGGGAVSVVTNAAPLVRLDECNFAECSAINGGAICALDSASTVCTDCVFDGCTANNGGGVYSNNTSQNTLNDCIIYSCSATSGGGVYSTGTSENTLNSCIFDGCSTTANGGAIYSAISSQNTLNDCTITGCDANYGAGVYSYGTSKNTLNGCVIKDCSANNNRGVGLYSAATSQNTLDGCAFDATASIYVRSTNALTITGGVTTISSAYIQDDTTITIEDGAALTITDTATINAATFTSEGRGYLAVGAGIDTSAATLTNVVLCAYGAGLRSFRINAAGAAWTADDGSIPILLEQKNGDTWTTIDASATDGSYATAFGLGATARAFDGETFLTATVVFHAWLEYEQTITVATATAKVYDVAAQTTNRYKITKGFIMASQYYNRGEAPVFFARIEDSETSTIVPQSAVSSISYTAYKVTTSWSSEKRTPVDGHEDVEVPLAAYLDALVNDDPRWTEDETGYNFIFEPDTTENPIFPDGGKYVVVVTIEFTGANPAPISYEIEVK